MTKIKVFFALTALLWSVSAGAQDLPEYVCWKTSGPVLVDGAGDEAAWQQAAPMALVDVLSIGDPRPHSRPTEVRMLWDDENLYVLFVAADPDVWSSLTERDDPLWDEEVVEIFFDPVGEALDYAEIEVNSLNTIVDLLVTRTPRRKSFFEWSPRLETAVQVGGTINDPDDTDQYWSMEIAMPWEALKTDISDVVGDRSLPPRDGEQWRFNFYRYERIREGGVETEIEYSAWSPTGEINFHMPERFGIVIFRVAPTAVEKNSWGRLKADSQSAG